MPSPRRSIPPESHLPGQPSHHTVEPHHRVNTVDRPGDNLVRDRHRGVEAGCDSAGGTSRGRECDHGHQSGARTALSRASRPGRRSAQARALRAGRPVQTFLRAQRQDSRTVWGRGVACRRNSRRIVLVAARLVRSLSRLSRLSSDRCEGAGATASLSRVDTRSPRRRRVQGASRCSEAAGLSVSYLCGTRRSTCDVAHLRSESRAIAFIACAGAFSSQTPAPARALRRRSG